MTHFLLSLKYFDFPQLFFENFFLLQKIFVKNKKIGDKVKLLETYIVCHDTFISEGTVGTITDLVTFNKNGTKNDVAWIDVGLTEDRI